MKVSKLLLTVLILAIVLLLASNLAMYNKSKEMSKVITQLNSVIQQQCSQMLKIIK